VTGRRTFDLRTLGVIAIGGALGAPARYGIAQAIEVGAHGFPWATFIANVTGAFALAVFVTWIGARRHAPHLLRPLVATGFLGAFTTFSTLAIECVLLVRNHRVPMAAIYLSSTVVAGLAVAAAGVALARRIRT
jgi:CrcB protein